MTTPKFAGLLEYLYETGWERIETPRDNIALFQKVANEELFEAVLPLDTSFADYEMRIRDVLESIARAEKRKVKEVVADVAARMKPASDDYFDEFVGRISQTKADPDPHTREGGEVMLNFIASDEEKVSKARISLGHEDYEIACKAHLDGKTVKVTGKLVTSGRTKVIESPKFEVL